ncbi:diguanylate cyclase response regulator [Psychromonas marina]|uniref:diguanylate cyclase n=1 Tax=Psychromonas marina TaxID=88364 RepID=A0ABQ6E332_9GAMM|nr:diguanylate cyclase [Psychromonas marina]GLS91720.1 diguanylate cyclase response regulator [Psychromonas marina]
MTNESPLILIVDDNPENIQFLGNLLVQQQYELGVALNGIEALKFIEHRLPDLILLDIMMPNMGGFEVCKHLKHSSLTNNIPVIFISAKVETEDIIQGLEMGGVDYVKKPFNSAELLLRVKTHLELKFNRETLEKEILKRIDIQKALEKANNELQQLSNLDGLTKIANRRRFDIAIKEEGDRAKRENMPLSLIMCDVDHFKIYNDTYGHQMGDTCLQKIAEVISVACQRPGDIAARYGGEEFAIILPNTDPIGALNIADTINNALTLLNIKHNQSPVAPFVTISMGIATLVTSGEVVIDRFIHRADKALYCAKKRGRNCIVEALHEI